MNGAVGDPWPRLSGRIAASLGLDFPPERRDALRRAVEGAARDLGFDDPERCAIRLAEEPPDEAELAVLASHLTVGETYFFRDPKLFDALEHVVLPEIMASRRGPSPVLRIWSAGCCTGEEAYSLAIVVHRLLPRFPGWSAAIHATDLNPRFLRRAIAAEYGEWSFRALPPQLRRECFVRLPDGRHAVRPEIRGMVRFTRANLVESPCPFAAGLDLILCRNVLMYFTPEQMRGTIRRLDEALLPGGWLVVSPSEASAERFPGFVPAIVSGAYLYRKEPPMARGDERPVAARPVAPRVAVPAPRVQREVAPFAPLSPAIPPAVVAADPDYAAHARACADRGALGEALEWCDRWIAARKLDASAHYLRAMVLLERGEPREARAALTRALYLRPRHILAHIACGHLERAAGAEEEAVRHFANASRLVERARPEEPVEDGDGITIENLREMLAVLVDPGRSA